MQANNDLLSSITPLDLRLESFRRKNFDFITVRQGKKHLRQDQALQILQDDTTEEFLFGGAAGGAKSWTGASDLAFKCMLYPDSNWFIGRKELKRITESTLKTFFKVCKEYGITDYKYNAQKNFIRFGNGSNIDLLELKYLPSDDEYERFGSTEYTGGWIEEISEVDFGAFDVLRTRIGRHLNDKYGIKGKIFCTANPTKKWVKKWFYDTDKAGTLEEYQFFLQSLVTDNPFAEQGYIEKLKRTKDKSKRERLLEGNWEYDDNAAALCTYDDIVATFSNRHAKLKDEFYVTADVARLGADKCIILVWDNWTVIDYRVIEKSKTTKVQKAINKFRYKYDIPKENCVADVDGVGGGVVDNCDIQGFKNNGAVVKIQMPEGKEKPNYKNYQTQCGYYLVKKINKKKLNIAANVPMRYQTEIIEEFGQLQSWKVDDDYKVHLLPKKEIKKNIGRSPDWRDAFLMRAHFDLTPKSDYFVVW